MKLNIGSGRFVLVGFINIDKIEYPGVNRVLEIKDKLDYPDESIEEIYMGHFIEHLKVEDAINFLRDCYRMLKKEGKITITIPDFEKIFQQFDFKMANQIIMAKDVPREINPSGEESPHKSLWTDYHLMDVLREIGFKDVITLKGSPYLASEVKWQSIIEAKK